MIQAPLTFSFYWPFLVLALTCPVMNAKAREKSFSATELMADKVTIEWRRVKSVNRACQELSQTKGHGKFGYEVEACAFWKETWLGYSCVIVTSRHTTLETLGHEVRHCFQGNYHR